MDSIGNVEAELDYWWKLGWEKDDAKVRAPSNCSVCSSQCQYPYCENIFMDFQESSKCEKNSDAIFDTEGSGSVQSTFSELVKGSTMKYMPAHEQVFHASDNDDSNEKEDNNKLLTHLENSLVESTESPPFGNSKIKDSHPCKKDLQFPRKNSKRARRGKGAKKNPQNNLTPTDDVLHKRVQKDEKLIVSYPNEEMNKLT